MAKERKTVAKNHLRDWNVNHVHLVGSQAVPDGVIQVIKGLDESIPAGQEMVEKAFEFVAKNVPKKQVFGYVAVPNVPDYQGDLLSPEEVEKSAHAFMKNLAHNEQKGEGSGTEHRVFKGAYPIISVLDVDGSVAKSYGGKGIAGGWFFGVQVTDDVVWKNIEDGKLNGFSGGGPASRVPVEKSAEPATADAGLVATVMSFIKNLNKGDGDAESYDEINARREYRKAFDDRWWTAYSALSSIIDDDTVTDKTAKLEESINQFRDDLITALKAADKAQADSTNSETNKSTTASSEGDTQMTMTKEQAQSLIDGNTKVVEALGNVTKALENLAPKPATPDPAAPGGVVDKTAAPGAAPAAAPAAEPTQADINKGILDQLTEINKKLKISAVTPGARNGGQDTTLAQPVTKAEGDGKSAVVEKGELAGTAFGFGGKADSE